MYDEAIECLMCGMYFQPDGQSFLCESCQNEEKAAINALSKPNSHVQKQFQCLKCTFKNPLDSIQCQLCQHVFQQKLDSIIPPKVQNKLSMVVCKNCKFENHIANEYCLSCDKELFQQVKKKCQICTLSVREDNYLAHYEACLLSQSMIEQENEKKPIKPIIQPYMPQLFQKPYGQYIKPIKPYIKPINSHKKPLDQPQKPGIMDHNRLLFGLKQQSTKVSCYYCYKKFQKVKIIDHTQKCQNRLEWEMNFEPKNSRMTPLQVKTMLYMHQKSAKEHQSVRQQLQQRIRKLGFSTQDLENLQFYIQNYAPIIIQIHISRHMEFFVKDTHYRNQFETSKSSGSLSRTSRTQWQDRMFDSHYSKATDFQRVKYGVINFTNDPKGVNCAKSYGPSYFLLKNHVRDRCTFTDKDTSSPDASIATFKFGFKIVSKMIDSELKAAFQASKALQRSSAVTITYKQIQIHGPIQFSKDIERVYANKAQINGDKRLLDLVYAFSQKFKVQYDFI